MRRHAFLIVSLLALLTSSTYALSIVPVFLNGGGQSWTVPERNVVNQAIQDWTSQFTGPNNSLTVAFTFDQLNGPLFQATANYASNPGDSVYPWSVQNITVTFNSRWMTLASDPTEIALRFTLTPPTSASFDGLTLTRNALGEILGFTT